MDKTELTKILENHKHWLYEDIEGWRTMRANLIDADLRNADLRNADLRNADLRNADLRNADLGYANLRYADLRGANLRYADLRDANLRYADLRGANLRDANLRYADLRYADLRGANLRDANLRYADLRYANLKGANLRGARNVPYIPYACPDTGAFIGYKKAKGMIVELEIQSDSKRLSATTRKCRCDKAKVLGIYDYDHNLLDTKEVTSDHCPRFVYKVGEIVKVDDFNEDRWEECSTGIHFFINFQEAVNY